jgi:Zn-dependent peptidase ImmA (M78 family)/transcriptional regulator with XRE-family HTH domain
MVRSSSLKKVRETRHFDLHEVAKYAGISADRLVEFETGAREPSSRQLERLADTYGLASYLLGADAIPNLPETLVDFRKTTPRPAQISPAGMARIWSAEEVSAAASQLAKALEFTAPVWSKSVPTAATLNADFARSLRSFFEEWFASRQKGFDLFGTDEQRFMAGFRLFIEAQGSIVRVNDAPPEDYLGFLIHPEQGLPTVFINRKISAPKAQLFTLLHEFGHRSLGLNGISNPFVVRNDTERNCNRFAAEFLAPEKSFIDLAASQPRTERGDVFRFVAAVSRRSLLSMHATAIRLVETGFLSQAQLKGWEAARQKSAPKELKTEELDLEAEATKSRAPHAKQIGEIGYLPTYLAKCAVDRKYIDKADVQAGIGLSASLQEKAFVLAARRFEVALR